jgi:hypothetical protein
MARQHGTHSCYVGGCRCAGCTAGETAYRADLRARRNSGGPVRPRTLAEVVAQRKPPKPAEPGPVERAVRVEVEQYAGARPALCAVAASLAQVLDGSAVTAKPSAARVLAMILNELAKGASRPPGKLSVVREMTRRSDGA